MNFNNSIVFNQKQFTSTPFNGVAFNSSLVIEDFITMWRTTTDNESITLPANGTNDITIDWGDGTTEYVTTANPSHTYATAGDYDVAIKGSMTSWYQASSGDKDKLIEIKNWGTNVWNELNYAFYGCSNMTCSAMDAPDLSQITNLTGMFFGCGLFNGIVNFDTSHVTNMQNMFRNCYSFNQSVSSFNTSNATNMRFMFCYCNSFDQSVSNFDTSNVSDMSLMFYGCSSFNQDVSMFNISSLTDASDMLTATSFSTENYDKLLIAWNNQTHNSNVPLGVGSTKYSSSALSARTDLINDGWTITDGGQI